MNFEIAFELIKTQSKIWSSYFLHIYLTILLSRDWHEWKNIAYFTILWIWLFTNKCFWFFSISQSRASRFINETSRAIWMLEDEMINWFQGPEIIMQEFHSLAFFSCCIGCIHCTHIRIRWPSLNNADNYLNRKGFNSINVQVICDY